jgi:hypothetical protein
MSGHLDFAAIDRVCDAVAELGARRPAPTRSKIVFEPVSVGSGGQAGARASEATLSAAPAGARTTLDS